MDPLIVGAIAAFAGTLATVIGNVILGRMNKEAEKTKSAEDAAALVTKQRLDFKDEQIAYWKSRYEECEEEHGYHHD